MEYECLRCKYVWKPKVKQPKSCPRLEDVLENVADEVIAALEHDVTLGGVVDWSLPTSGTWGHGEKETPVRYLELIVQSEGRVVR